MILVSTISIGADTAARIILETETGHSCTTLCPVSVGIHSPTLRTRLDPYFLLPTFHPAQHQTATLSLERQQNPETRTRDYEQPIRV